MTPDPFISSKLSRTHPQAPTCTAPGSPLGTVALGPEGVENAGSWASHLVAGPAQTFLYQLAWRPESGLSSCQLRARPSPGADRGRARRGHSGPPGPTWAWEQGPRCWPSGPHSALVSTVSMYRSNMLLFATGLASCWKPCSRPEAQSATAAGEARGASVRADGWSRDPATSKV